MNRVYLALGSNINPETNLPAAVALLRRLGTVAKVSTVWETAPVGDIGQANFLNAAVLLETSLDLRGLRAAIRKIESELQRVRDPHNRNAARTIDIDVALFNRECLAEGQRTIPDPDILTRKFVALPLAELDADYVHPQVGQTLADIAAGVVSGSDPMLPRPDVRLCASE